LVLTRHCVTFDWRLAETKVQNMHKIILSTAMIAGLAQGASAQEVYFGGGLAYSSGTSTPGQISNIESDLDAGMLTLIVGQRFAAGQGFWGWETSADLSFGAETESNPFGAQCATDGAAAPYLCKHDATIRVVGHYGLPVADATDVFGSLGVGILQGDYADNSNSVESAYTYGATVGVGVDHAFGNGLAVRGEVIYDSFTNDTQDDFSSEYKGTSVRVAVLRRF
jgi:hypothetical protein